MILEQDFLEYAKQNDFGDLHFKLCNKTGMMAIIAIHNSTLGPALGGCRFIEYSSSKAAIFDAIRLARGMSYKAASANLPLGGGKSVIIKPKGPFDRKAYFQSFGQFVQELNGRYITALDSGTLLEDMSIIAEHTPYVASLPGQHGDPSPSTAQGVLRGIEAAVAYKLGKDSVKGLRISIQGLGHVGYDLAQRLHHLGAHLTVADTNTEMTQKAAQELGAQVVDTSIIHSIPVDVFAPCALGAIINNTSINELDCRIIAGAANNQLEQSQHGQMLFEQGILYAPDYVINAGGLIFAAAKYLKTPEAKITAQIDNIGHSLSEIFAQSDKMRLPTNVIADQLAEAKLGIK